MFICIFCIYLLDYLFLIGHFANDRHPLESIVKIYTYIHMYAYTNLKLMCMYAYTLMNIVSMSIFNCLWKVRGKISAMIL